MLALYDVIRLDSYDTVSSFLGLVTCKKSIGRVMAMPILRSHLGFNDGAGPGCTTEAHQQGFYDGHWHDR